MTADLKGSFTIDAGRGEPVHDNNWWENKKAQWFGKRPGLAAVRQKAHEVAEKFDQAGRPTGGAKED